MNDDISIKVDHVSKKYCRNIKDSMAYGVTDVCRNLFGLSSNPDRLRKNEFWAVSDVSFEVKKGATLGIIGPNGSGKTTMLKMLNGIFWPDKGKISIRGKIGALIAVGAGFHPQLSGRENIYINGAILGMSKKESDQKFDSIVDFSGIGEFLDAPVKHYSSGMYVRLGFAIAVHCEPDILLIDEVLSVGDIDFQARCISKIKEMDKQGVTKIFISHNLNTVQLLCAKALYIAKGHVKHYGDTQFVINEFKKDVLLNRRNDKKEAGGLRYGTREVEITQVEFVDGNGQAKNVFKRGESLKVKIKYSAKKSMDNPEFVVGFVTEDGALLSFAHTSDHGFSTGEISGEGEINYAIERLPFNVGKYSMTVGCWDATGQLAYDHHSKLYDLVIEDGYIDNRIHERMGHVYIPSKWAKL